MAADERPHGPCPRLPPAPSVDGMELLVTIGLALAIVTALSVVVESMAEARGRHRWAWVIASLAGLAFAVVGWFVVVGALVLLGPSSDKRKIDHAVPAPTHS